MLRAPSVGAPVTAPGKSRSMPRAATSMPTIATFHGVTIRLYANDHQPPHFHALHGDDEALVAIVSVKVLEGLVPGPAQGCARVG